jgi:hypothetical protein
MISTKEEDNMKKGIIYKMLIYFLCISFLLMMNGFQRMVAEAKEMEVPLGEMVSKGEVKFEARENVWKKVESSHFPIFQGTRVKIEKGSAIVTHSNNSQIELSQNSFFSFEQKDQLILFQGSVGFRLPSSSDINFKVGKISIIKDRALQAGKGTYSPLKEEVTMGSISIHSNGSATIKAIQGKLSILNQDQVVLAALSSNESVTIPSTTVGGKQPVMVAQVPPAAGGAGIFGVTGTGLAAAGAAVGIGIAVGVGVTSTTGDVETEPHCR